MIITRNVIKYKYIGKTNIIKKRFFFSNVKPLTVYNNLALNKKHIINENKGKIGIYRWVNKSDGYSYIGSSSDIASRLRKYYCLGYLNNKLLTCNSRIYKVLLEQNYSNFYLEILEYCDKKSLIEREQYYLDLLKPEYNILKIAGSLLGFKHSNATLVKFKSRVHKPGYLTFITNSESNTVRQYASVREAAKATGITHTTLLRYIKTNKNLKGITVKVLKSSVIK